MHKILTNKIKTNKIWIIPSYILFQYFDKGKSLFFCCAMSLMHVVVRFIAQQWGEIKDISVFLLLC